MGLGHRHCRGDWRVFEPLKRRIQGWVDRAFDRHRYDYRKALVEFGRGLSSETDLQALLNSIVEQLPRTLLVARVAIFLTEESGRLRLAASHGLPEEISAARGQIWPWASSTSTAPRTTRTSFLKTLKLPFTCRLTSSAPPPCST